MANGCVAAIRKGCELYKDVKGTISAAQKTAKEVTAIAEIVAQGDRNTIALNACVDSYNEVRNLLNGKP